MPNFLFTGRVCRDYYISSDGEAINDVLGGNLPYAAVGFKLWGDSIPGLISRVGEDFPQNWLEEMESHSIDTRGINILPDAIDVRSFYIYTDKATQTTGEPIPFYSNRDLPFPKALLGYRDSSKTIDSRTDFSPTSIRGDDIPEEYKTATVAHLCPVDYLTHSYLPETFRQIGITSITLDPAPGYMNPTFWDNVPSLVTGLSAFLPAEEDLRYLFKGQTEDLWEMADHIASFGCEIIVIKRGERGQLVLDAGANKRWEIPAYDSRLVNPTGAEDAFCGGFIAGYSHTYDPVEAALHGNISAAIVSEGVGVFFALDVLPGLAQARLEHQRQRVRRL